MKYIKNFLKNAKGRVLEPIPKRYNQLVNKWETSWILLKTLKISKYEIARGYPETKYIVDKTYSISLCKRG